MLKGNGQVRFMPAGVMGRFEVWCVSRGEARDQAALVEAGDHASAAEVWAQQDADDRGSYSIVGGEEAQVVVLCLRTEVRVGFVVTGNAHLVYSARPVCKPYRVGGGRAVSVNVGAQSPPLGRSEW